MSDPVSLGRELQNGPSDGITSLQFFEDESKLLASSWDGVGLSRPVFWSKTRIASLKLILCTSILQRHISLTLINVNHNWHESSGVMRI